MTSVPVKPPARRPCESCPYRQDVPSGIWHPDEYAKLPRYDEPTYQQPIGIFLCHLTGTDTPASRVCAGWAGCHDGNELLSLRLGVRAGSITAATMDAVIDYKSPVPLFESGAAAADHGMQAIGAPGADAYRVMGKVVRAQVLRQPRAGRGGAWVTRCRPCIRDEHGACRGDRDRAISCNCECLDLDCCLDGTCGRCVDQNEGI